MTEVLSKAEVDSLLEAVQEGYLDRDSGDLVWLDVRIQRQA